MRQNNLYRDEIVCYNCDYSRKHSMYLVCGNLDCEYQSDFVSPDFACESFTNEEWDILSSSDLDYYEEEDKDYYAITTIDNVD